MNCLIMDKLRFIKWSLKPWCSSGLEFFQGSLRVLLWVVLPHRGQWGEPDHSNFLLTTDEKLNDVKCHHHQDDAGNVIRNPQTLFQYSANLKLHALVGVAIGGWRGVVHLTDQSGYLTCQQYSKEEEHRCPEEGEIIGFLLRVHFLLCGSGFKKVVMLNCGCGSVITIFGILSIIRWVSVAIFKWPTFAAFCQLLIFTRAT